ncbi:MAG: GGDEF domain-containing protein [Candidatus Magnetobacterium sp. LHC-1]
MWRQFADNQTGLLSKGGVIKQFGSIIRTIKRQERGKASATDDSGNLFSSYAVFFIDIAGMKHLNETLGVKRGDMLIIKIADLLTNTFTRSTDLCCRWEDDDFVVITINTSKDDAIRLLEKVEEGLSEEVYLNIGLCIFPDNASVLESISRTEEVMKKVKQQVKDSIDGHTKKINISVGL